MDACGTSPTDATVVDASAEIRATSPTDADVDATVDAPADIRATSPSLFSLPSMSKEADKLIEMIVEEFIDDETVSYVGETPSLSER